MADEQLRRDGLLGESVHLARERARRTGGSGEPEPEPESEPAETPRAAEVAGLAAGVRELVRRDASLLKRDWRRAARLRRSKRPVSIAQMKPVVQECDLRVHSVLKSQHDLSNSIEHLASELDRFMGLCGEQREALVFDPYVEKLNGCKTRLANVNAKLNAVEQRMQRMQRQIGN